MIISLDPSSTHLNMLLALSATAALVAVAAPRSSDATLPVVPGDSLQIRFEDHRFTPQTLTVASGRRLVIKVVNASTETIEFESFKLNREMVMEPGDTVVVHLHALNPGRYDFYDDFHQDVPEGAILAK